MRRGILCEEVHRSLRLCVRSPGGEVMQNTPHPPATLICLDLPAYFPVTWFVEATYALAGGTHCTLARVPPSVTPPN